MNTDKSRIGSIARAMINGSINYFIGSEQLLSLRDEFGIYANDPDFVPFVGVLVEIDYLRENGAGFNWNLLEEPELQLKVAESLKWAKEISLASCESLSRRYPV